MCFPYVTQEIYLHGHLHSFILGRLIDCNKLFGMQKHARCNKSEAELEAPFNV